MNDLGKRQNQVGREGQIVCNDSDGAQVWRGHCPGLEHHHLIIRTRGRLHTHAHFQLSNDRSIELTLYILVFFLTILDCQNYSSTDTSYYYFFDLIFIKYISLGFQLSYLRHLLQTFFFAFIGSTFIDPETFSRVCKKFVFGTYPNRTYVFAYPTGLWKAVVRVLVFVISTIVINTLIGFKAVTQVGYWTLIYKLQIRLLLLLVLQTRFIPRDTMAHLVNTWTILVGCWIFIYKPHKRMLPFCCFR